MSKQHATTPPPPTTVAVFSYFLILVLLIFKITLSYCRYIFNINTALTRFTDTKKLDV